MFRTTNVTQLPGYAEAVTQAGTLLTERIAGMTNEQVYREAFAPLVTNFPDDARQEWMQRGHPDPIMIGTDQRTQFLAPLARHFGNIRQGGGQVFDVGAGNGETTRLAFGHLPQGTTVHALEPNPVYVAQYQRTVETTPGLIAGKFMADGFRGFLPEAGQALNPEVLGMDPISLLLAIHMIYFVGSTEAELIRFLSHCCAMLERGGTMFSVVALESKSYTGQAMIEYLSGSANSVETESFREFARFRESLFVPDVPANMALTANLQQLFPYRRFHFGYETQETSLFSAPGNSLAESLANLMLMAFITTLTPSNDLPFEVEEKVQTMVSLFLRSGETLRIGEVQDGPYAGRFRVSQPQRVGFIRRLW